MHYDIYYETDRGSATIIPPLERRHRSHIKRSGSVAVKGVVDKFKTINVARGCVPVDRLQDNRQDFVLNSVLRVGKALQSIPEVDVSLHLDQSPEQTIRKIYDAIPKTSGIGDGPTDLIND